MFGQGGIPIRGSRRRHPSQSLKCTLPQEILPIEFPIEMHVYLSFFLHLRSLHPLHSYTLSSYIIQMDPSSTPYISFTDGASRFDRNIASTT